MTCLCSIGRSMNIDVYKRQVIYSMDLIGMERQNLEFSGQLEMKNITQWGRW